MRAHYCTLAACNPCIPRCLPSAQCWEAAVTPSSTGDPSLEDAAKKIWQISKILLSFTNFLTQFANSLTLPTADTNFGLVHVVPSVSASPFAYASAAGLTYEAAMAVEEEEVSSADTCNHHPPPRQALCCHHDCKLEPSVTT